MKTNRHAFSVVELLVAILVLTVGFFALYDLLTASMKQKRAIEQTRWALTIAESEIEHLRATDFTKLTPQQDGAFLAPITTLAQLPDAAATLTIRERSPRLKEIIVTVRWKPAHRSQQITLSTLIAQTP